MSLVPEIGPIRIPSTLTVYIDYVKVGKPHNYEEFVDDEKVINIVADCQKSAEYVKGAIGIIVRRTASDNMRCPGCDNRCYLGKIKDYSEFLDHGKDRDTRILRRTLIYKECNP